MVKLSDIKQSTSLDLLAKQLVEGFITGLHKSPYHGFSVEFSEHRLYNEGESTKHIDWKVYGRTDKLFTKRYSEETNLRCLLMIDTSPSMYYPKVNNGKVTFSVMAAASLAHLMQRQHDAVGLCTFSDKIDSISTIKSTPAHVDKLYKELEQILTYVKPTNAKATATNTSRVLHEIADKIHKRSMIILFSDLFDSESSSDELFKALQHLKHEKHEVIVFHVTDKATEYSFDFSSRPTEFIDLESGTSIILNPEEVRETYKKNATSFYALLKLQCQQFKIDFIEANVEDPFQKILQAYLVKRARLK